jgi:putative transposase
MARKDYTPEQAIGMLREAEVRLSQGEKIGKICRGLGISEQSYYRWRRLYGGPKVDQARRLKDLERDNHRLKKATLSNTSDRVEGREVGGETW